MEKGMLGIDTDIGKGDYRRHLQQMKKRMLGIDTDIGKRDYRRQLQ